MFHGATRLVFRSHRVSYALTKRPFSFQLPDVPSTLLVMTRARIELAIPFSEWSFTFICLAMSPSCKIERRVLVICKELVVFYLRCRSYDVRIVGLPAVCPQGALFILLIRVSCRRQNRTTLLKFMRLPIAASYTSCYMLDSFVSCPGRIAQKIDSFTSYLGRTRSLK